MRTKLFQRLISGASLCFAVLWAFPVSAQTFSSGSTGADGAFAPSCTPTPCTVTVTMPSDGVFNFTTVTVPAGVSITFTPNVANTPVTILASGDGTISGALNLNGQDGADTSLSVMVNMGGQGGPGGFVGGNGGVRGGGIGSAGRGAGGGAPAPTIGTAGGGGLYGAPSSFVSLLPLFGGSGGGGGLGDASPLAGASGGGGGGAIVIASSTKITVSGSITANGGGASNTTSSCGNGAGTGSGGAIRLVAPAVTGTGTSQAVAGTPTGCTASGGPGVVRIEAFTLGFDGPITPLASLSASPGPVTAASNPALINLPSLRISSVGGVPVPATPGGSFATADVSLSSGTNPVTVNLAATNIPLGTDFTVKLIPQFASATTVDSSPSTGTFASSTATANVTLPSGQVTVLQAFQSFTLAASLFPLIDGEPVEQVMVAANYGQPSAVTLITKSGKEVRADQLPIQDQLAFAKGWEAMRRDQ